MQVICEASYPGCDYPKAFTWQGHAHSVERVIKEWREPGHKHFIVAAAKCSHFELDFSETSYAWNILAVSGSLNQ